MEHIGLTIVGGIGILIFAYLLFSHGDAATQVLNGGFSGTSALIKALQGR